MLVIRRDGDLYYWSMFIHEKPYVGRALTIPEVITQVLRQRVLATPKRAGVGKKKDGRWHVRTLEGGVVQDRILGDIRQLANC